MLTTMSNHRYGASQLSSFAFSVWKKSARVYKEFPGDVR